MAKKTVSVEFFFAGGCEKCVEAREDLRKAAEATSLAEWTEIDIGNNPNRAVDAGVLTTPAVAINGELVFTSAPTPLALRSAIEARAGMK